LCVELGKRSEINISLVLKKKTHCKLTIGLSEILCINDTKKLQAKNRTRKAPPLRTLGFA